MKLNKDWQKQWDSIEIPEKKLEAIIQTQVKPQPKRKKAKVLQILKRKPVKNGLLLAAVLFLIFAGVSYLRGGSDLSTSSTGAYQSKSEVKAPTAEAENDFAADEGDTAFDEGAETAPEVNSTAEDGAVSSVAEGDASEAKSSDGTSENADKTAYYYRIEKETTTFDKDVTALQRLTNEAGGYISKSSVETQSEYTDNRYAYYILKIPADEKDDFLAQLKKIATTTSENVNSSNYAMEYSDNESRIKALETQEKALLEMLAKSATIDEMLKIQDRLATVRTERERLTSSNRIIDNQVEYVSITLTMNEITKIEKKEKSDSPAAKIKNNWDKQVKFWGDTATRLWIFLASNVFYLLILGAGAGAGIVVYRKKRKKKSKV